jgi:hypothetical protein
LFIKEVSIMAKVKSNSISLEKASTRLQGMKAINPTLDLGSGLSVAAIEAAINDARAKLDSYNQMLSMIEEKQAAFRDAEIALSEITTRVLAGIAAKFGKDSIEYAQVGGTRKRDRKRPIQKAKANSKESA